MSKDPTRMDRIVQLILLGITLGTCVAIVLSLQPPGEESPGGGPPGRSRKGASQEEVAVTVETSLVERGDVSRSIKINGDVVVDTAVSVYPNVAGNVVQVNYELGQRVRQGSAIASVDPSLPGQNFSVSPVTAPIGGTIISLPIQRGDRITSQTVVGVIGNLENLIILTYVPERFVTSVQKGLGAQVSLDAFPGETFYATVLEISPVMDAVTRTLSVKLSLDGEDPRIRPGMFATTTLITEESRDTLTVPNGAISLYYDQEVVYLLGEGGRARRVEVETGLKSDQETEVLSGLVEGDLIILQGQSKLTDGTLVRSISREE